MLVFAVTMLFGLSIYTITVLNRQKKRINQIFGSKSANLDLERLLHDYLDEHKLAMARVEKIYTGHTRLVKQLGTALQKTGLVRFNPFSDTGGDQSFALSLLDSNDNGIILTAIHGREGTRIYTKAIEYGKCSHSLSNEEAAALAAAIKSSN